MRIYFSCLRICIILLLTLQHFIIINHNFIIVTKIYNVLWWILCSPIHYKRRDGIVLKCLRFQKSSFLVKSYVFKKWLLYQMTSPYDSVWCQFGIRIEDIVSVSAVGDQNEGNEGRTQREHVCCARHEKMIDVGYGKRI